MDVWTRASDQHEIWKWARQTGVHWVSGLLVVNGVIREGVLNKASALIKSSVKQQLTDYLNKPNAELTGKGNKILAECVMLRHTTGHVGTVTKVTKAGLLVETETPFGDTRPKRWNIFRMWKRSRCLEMTLDRYTLWRRDPTRGINLARADRNKHQEREPENATETPHTPTEVHSRGLIYDDPAAMEELNERNTQEAEITVVSDGSVRDITR